MQIYKYLTYIKSGKPVNFDCFKKQLAQHGVNEQTVLEIFSTDKLSRTSYLVSILDQHRFNQFLIDFPEHAVTDRVSAAQAGNSHKHRVSKAMIVLWSELLDHPVVVLNDGDQITTPVSLSKRLLIIENQENFVQKQQTLDFLQQQFPDFKRTNLDIVHGAGNAICNRLNKAFFSQYQQIDCLLDLDIGGLEIFTNLVNLTRHEKLNFLLPPCAGQLLKTSKIPLLEKHLLMLRKYHKQCPLLQPAIEMMLKHGKMLEQELYL